VFPQALKTQWDHNGLVTESETDEPEQKKAPAKQKREKKEKKEVGIRTLPHWTSRVNVFQTSSKAGGL
jgi:hypothetical protein